MVQIAKCRAGQFLH